VVASYLMKYKKMETNDALKKVGIKAEEGASNAGLSAYAASLQERKKKEEKEKTKKKKEDTEEKSDKKEAKKRRKATYPLPKMKKDEADDSKEEKKKKKGKDDKKKTGKERERLKKSKTGSGLLQRKNDSERKRGGSDILSPRSHGKSAKDELLAAREKDAKKEVAQQEPKKTEETLVSKEEAQKEETKLRKQLVNSEILQLSADGITLLRPKKGETETQPKGKEKRKGDDEEEAEERPTRHRKKISSHLAPIPELVVLEPQPHPNDNERVPGKKSSDEDEGGKKEDGTSPGPKRRHPLSSSYKNVAPNDKRKQSGSPSTRSSGGSSSRDWSAERDIHDILVEETLRAKKRTRATSLGPGDAAPRPKKGSSSKEDSASGEKRGGVVAPKGAKGRTHSDRPERKEQGDRAKDTKVPGSAEVRRRSDNKSPVAYISVRVLCGVVVWCGAM